MASEGDGIELGQRLFAEGRTREAAATLEAPLTANDGPGAAWRLLGDIRLVAGDVAAAQFAYDRMLAAVVPDPSLRAPALDLAAGRPADAASALGERVKRQPGALPALHLFGEALLRQGQVTQAQTVLAHVLNLAPNLHLARLAYALLLQRLARHDEAIAEFDRLLAREPRHHRARMAKAASLTEIDDYAAAAEVTAALLQDFPDQPRGWLVHGNGLRTLGRIDEAIAAYRRCLALDPANGEAWWSLANLKAYRFAADDLAAMKTHLSASTTSVNSRSHLHFALGKACEDERRYADAFTHYAEANAIQRRLRPYDSDATTSLVRRSQALFTPQFFAERSGWGDASPDPIFIVGLPRSGSTLVDQILASHPAIEGGRELMDIQSMADWVGAQGTDYPSALASLPSGAIATLGRDYIVRTRPRRRLGRPRFTDKAPWNFLHVGLIRLVLPNAKIVDVRRHPLGCGLSAFKQHFAGGFDFSHDLTDLGRYYADYVGLMAHCDAVLPGHVHRVVYEDLVADTETEVRRLLDYLGLPFDPATLRFFDNPRAVATPSSEQVRRPIFTEGLDQWRRFEPWLGPLKDALGPVLDVYPSPP